MSSHSEQNKLSRGRHDIPVSSAKWKQIWLLYPTLFLLNAHGQDALFSSISLDQAVSAESRQTEFTQLAAQPHLGPVQFALGVYGGVSYDDNVNGSQLNPEADVISRAGINLAFTWPATERSELQLGTGIGYLDYEKYTGNNGLEISPDSVLTYAVSLDNVEVTLFDQVSYSREVRTEAALANVTTLPQFDNDVGLKAEWDPEHWVFMASYSHDDFLSDHAHGYLNRSSEYFLGRAGWRFAEATQMGVEASDSIAAYQRDSQNNNQNLSLGGYLDWMMLPSLHFVVRGGPVFYEPDSPNSAAGNSTINTYYVNLQVTHQLTDFLSHSLNIDRSLQAGLNQGGSHIEQLAINYNITWALTQRITLSASASYVNGKQPLSEDIILFGSIVVPVIVNEDYQQYGAGINASWRFTDHLTANLGYNHILRDSNLSGRSNSDNTASLQLNYTF